MGNIAENLNLGKHVLPPLLPTYKSKQVGHWAKTVWMYITKNQKIPQSWGLGLYGLREGFSYS